MGRFRYGVAVAVVATGCFDPVLTPGQPCAPPPDRCPGDLVCIDERCVEPGTPGGDAAPGPDARVDGATNVDTDHDGVDDASDNCVDVSNPDQYDEDTDGPGDLCDVCPHLPDPGQADADTDLVGDACDHDSQNGTDAWVVFEGWNGPAPPAGWTLDPGWTVGGGQLRGPTDVTTLSRAVYSANLDAAYVVTRTHIVAVDDNAGGAYRSSGVLSAVAGTNEYRCLIRDTPGTPANGATLRNNNTLASTNLPGVVLGSVTTIGLVDVGNALGCAGATEDGRSWSDSQTDGSFGQGVVGVRVQHAAATFDYIAIIKPGP